MSGYGPGGWPPQAPPPPGGYGGPLPPGPPPPGAGWPPGGAPGWPSPPGPPMHPQQPASSRAVLALVLAIVSWVLCGCFASLPAVFIARSEVSAIERGESPPAGKSMAEVSFWVALINLILYGLVAVLYVVVVLIMGISILSTGTGP